MAKTEVPPEMEFDRDEDEFEEYAERVTTKPSRYVYAWEKVAENAVPPSKFTTCCGTRYGAMTAADLDAMLRHHRESKSHQERARA